MHIDEQVIDAEGRINPHKIDLVARMGADYYCRASGASVFEIAKPLTSIGIGVDALPAAVRNSTILTGNNLGQLGNCEQLPSAADVEAFVKSASYVSLVLKSSSTADRILALHAIAKQQLDAGDVRGAWVTLMSAQN